MATAASWYKIQIHTFDTGKRGTNAAVFFRFWDNLVPITPPLPNEFDYQSHGSLQCNNLSLTDSQVVIMNQLQISMERGMPWLKLDSPGNSHEPGDDDIYYFVITGIEGRLTGWNKLLISGTKRDHWTYELLMFRWENNAWNQVHHIPKRTSYVDADASKPNSLPSVACCHIYADKTLPPEKAGEGLLPEGVVVNELSPATY